MFPLLVLVLQTLGSAPNIPDPALRAEPFPALPMEVVPPAPDELPMTHDARPLRAGPKILFVNFDGGQMSSCNNNDPATNCSRIFGGRVLPYTGNAANRAAIIQAARSRVADFGISITNERPASGDYDMEMVGDWENAEPDFAGIAPGGDCWDNNGGETSFTLQASNSTDGMTEIMLQELAHTWGLEHVDSQTDLLFPTTDGSNKRFRDECFQIVANIDLDPTSGRCDHHAEACGDYSHQNSHAELLMIFGPSIPDTTPPTVEILAPPDGAMVTGGNVDLHLYLEDNERPAILETTITLEGAALPAPAVSEAGYPSPNDDLVLPLTNLPNGSYTLRVAAIDESANPAGDEIHFTVEGSPTPMPSDDADDTGTPADDGEGGSDSAADGGTGETADPLDDTDGADGTGADSGQLDAEPRGCACHSHGAGRVGADGALPQGLGAALGLLLLFTRRRIGANSY